jgi:hypothetical protein
MNAKVFTTVPGLRLSIGIYGTASNDEPAIVPDEVADQLEAEIRGHRMEDAPDPDDPAKTVRVEVKYSKEAVLLARRLKVVREPAPSAPAKAGRLSAAEIKAAQPPAVAEAEKK